MTKVLCRYREWAEQIDTLRTQTLMLTFFTGSAIGWVWEMVYAVVTSGELVNRGFLHGPWLPIYGCGCLLMLGIRHICNVSKGHFFVLSMAGCAIVEYSTSWALETLCGVRWWDYTGELMNLNGRICLMGLLFFAGAGMLVIYLLEPKFARQVAKLGERKRETLCTVCAILFAVDLGIAFHLPNLAAATKMLMH
jgi:Predicted membrane protein